LTTIRKEKLTMRRSWLRGDRRAILLLACLVGGSAPAASAQELVPAAFTPAPVGVNLLTMWSGMSSGDVTFDPSLPVEDVSARIFAWAGGYGRTFSFFGRSANVGFVTQYLVGNLEGKYIGEQTEVRRSGLGDTDFRLAVIVMGAPAMDGAAFRGYRPGTLLGASLIVRTPTGQYDPSKLINVGANRWAFKPGVGVIHTAGDLSLEASLAGWFYSDNQDFNGGKTRSQGAILSTEGHARLTVSPSVWASLDGNFWVGGRTTVDGVDNDDLQRNSRVGLTLAWRVAPGHGVRFAASRGAFTRIGGDFTSMGVSYSYSWM
jgi:hypothetical protein